MNKSLLKRIEKLERTLQSLEQAVREIRNSCVCVAEFEEPGPECPGSICGGCEELDCICKDGYEQPENREEPEEHECEDGCPSCQGHCEIIEEPIQEQDHD